MTKKKLPATIEECKTEIEQTEKQLRQYENKGKILFLLFPLISPLLSLSSFLKPL